MKTVIIGSGGHARVVYDILLHDKNMEIIAFVDNSFRGSHERIMRIPVVGDHSVLPELVKQGIKGYIVAVGDNDIRAKHFATFLHMGLEPINAIHPTAHLGHDVKIGRGVVVCANATICTGAVIKNNVIINTSAIIEHEDIVGEHAHIGPGASIAGRVSIEDGAFVGIGSVVKDSITIGTKAIVGAGSVVLGDIPPYTVAVGSPAKPLKTREGHKENESLKPTKRPESNRFGISSSHIIQSTLHEIANLK